MYTFSVNMTNKVVIYADHAATTPLLQEAFEAMLPVLKEVYLNPSSSYSFSRGVKQHLSEARVQIAACLNALPEEIFFTSGGTESDNWAIKGIADARASTGKHIITSAIEHHAVLNTCKYLTRHGYDVTFLKPDEKGRISRERLLHALRPDTILISLMLANNEIGTIEDISSLAAIIRSSGIAFHTDAVQAVGHIPIDVQMLDIDLLSASAHKFNGPKGIGFLYIRKGVQIASLMDGGQQEAGFRAGTENVAAAVGMAVALKNSCAKLDNVAEKLRKMELIFRSEIREKIATAVFNGDECFHLPGHISLSLPGISGEALLHILDLKGIAISTGAACNSQSVEISHVLKAIDLPTELAKGTIRISFGSNNNEEDAHIIASEIVKYWRKVCQLSGKG